MQLINIVTKTLFIETKPYKKNKKKE